MGVLSPVPEGVRKRAIETCQRAHNLIAAQVPEGVRKRAIETHVLIQSNGIVCPGRSPEEGYRNPGNPLGCSVSKSVPEGVRKRAIETSTMVWNSHNFWSRKESGRGLSKQKCIFLSYGISRPGRSPEEGYRNSKRRLLSCMKIVPEGVRKRAIETFR